MMNATQIDWYSKKQATVETVTYGSEFVAAKICVEQIIDLRNTLRYLGVPICEKSYMFGNNKSVVNSLSISHAKLHKRHTVLFFIASVKWWHQSLLGSTSCLGPITQHIF